MPSLLNAAPLPAVMLALGCMTGLAGSRYAPEDAITEAPAPSAAMAGVPGRDDQNKDGPGDADAPSGEGDGGSQVVRASDGLFYIGAQVNGRRVRFLVDTGASVTVLRAADAKALGLTPEAGRFAQKVETVGGSTAMAWTHLASVKLAGRELHDVRAAVVRQGLGVSLLGQNMLSRMGSVRIEGDRLELR
ncbi:retropepsin-like aspartic protease family protein [Sphingomonas bacterium]|uniref:retropepsin-like aspartic protease family protein n=1 Tax=Sphingomonas bacterium TaxID=1895847 RepID=UPI001576C034|nr:retropepsin-like aspartic protease [Sphingomonas bacterium]